MAFFVPLKKIKIEIKKTVIDKPVVRCLIQSPAISEIPYV